MQKQREFLIRFLALLFCTQILHFKDLIISVWSAFHYSIDYVLLLFRVFSLVFSSFVFDRFFDVKRWWLVIWISSSSELTISAFIRSLDAIRSLSLITLSSPLSSFLTLTISFRRVFTRDFWFKSFSSESKKLWKKSSCQITSENTTVRIRINVSKKETLLICLKRLIVWFTASIENVQFAVIMIWCQFRNHSHSLSVGNVAHELTIELHYSTHTC